MKGVFHIKNCLKTTEQCHQVDIKHKLKELLPCNMYKIYAKCPCLFLCVMWHSICACDVALILSFFLVCIQDMMANQPNMLGLCIVNSDYIQRLVREGGAKFALNQRQCACLAQTLEKFTKSIENIFSNTDEFF